MDSAMGQLIHGVEFFSGCRLGPLNNVDISILVTDLEIGLEYGICLVNRYRVGG